MAEVIRDRSSRVKRCVAEASGTFMLVAVGTGAVMLAATTGAFGQFGIALAFGLIVAIVVAGSDRLGGAHINPAVTIGLWSVRRFPGRDVLLYVVAQCVGAIAASAVMSLIVGPVGNLGATVPTIPLVRAFAIEAGYTAILAYVIMVVATADRSNPTVAALAIGATVFVGAWVTGPLTGGSFNRRARLDRPSSAICGQRTGSIGLLRSSGPSLRCRPMRCCRYCASRHLAPSDRAGFTVSSNP